MTDEFEDRSKALSPAAAIFWASFLGLFLELALIRWIASEVGVFAFAKNLVLVACFLGFGETVKVPDCRGKTVPADVLSSVREQTAAQINDQLQQMLSLRAQNSDQVGRLRRWLLN